MRGGLSSQAKSDKNCRDGSEKRFGLRRVPDRCNGGPLWGALVTLCHQGW
jgi:hypothetical protein